MPIQPITNLPLRSAPRPPSKPSGISRGIDAKVSISQGMGGKGGSQGPLTSIADLGRSPSSVTTSANEPTSIYDTDERADDLRYHYAKQSIRERKKAETTEKAVTGKAVKGEKVSPYKLPIKTGSAFRLKGPWGLSRSFERQRRAHLDTFRNLSAKDRKYFLDLVGEHAKAVRVGTGFGRLRRRDMKIKVEQDRRKGVISWEDAKDMKKMINELEG